MLQPGAAAFAQEPPPLSPVAFAQLMNAAAAELDDLAPAPTRDELQQVIDGLALPRQVAFTSGATVTVTEAALLGDIDLDDGSGAKQTLRFRFEGAARDAIAAGGTPAVDRGRIDAAVAAAYGRDRPQPGWLQRIDAAIGRFVAWLGGWIGRGVDSVGRGGGIVALLLIGLFVWYVASRVRPSVVPDIHGGPGGSVTATVDWAAEARAAIDAGDWNRAVRALYHVLLDVLERRGFVEDAPSLTTGECRAAVARVRPELLPAVRDATQSFERIAYGDADAGADDVERLLAAEREARTA
jgi:hypothetical protein